MQTNASTSRLRRGGLNGSMVGFAAAGVSGTAMMTANAAIIKSGPQNLSTSTLIGDEFTGDLEPVNIDGAGLDEFTLNSFSTKGSDFHWTLDHTAGFGLIEQPNSFYIGKLAFGQLISSSDAFTFGPAEGFVDNQTDFFPPSEAPWNYGSDGYIGFQFNPSGSQILYGWGHVTISLDRTVLTLVDWAYENTGAPIRAGEIPEPTTSLLLTGGLLVAGLWRRLKTPLRA